MHFQAQYRMPPSWGPDMEPLSQPSSRVTGSVDLRARLLVFRAGEILWDEGSRNTEAQTGDFASEIGKIGRDGSIQ